MISAIGLVCVASLALPAPSSSTVSWPAPLQQVGATRDSQKAEALLAEADRLYRQEQFQAALPLLDQALTLYRSSNDRRGEAAVLNATAVTFLRLGDFQRALTLSDPALRIARDLGDLDEQLQALTHLAHAHIRLSDSEKGIAELLEALAIAQKTNDAAAQATIIDNIAQAYQQAHDPRRALEWFARARAMYGQRGDAEAELTVLTAMRAIYEEAEDYPSLLAIDRDSLALAGKLDDREQQATILQRQGGTLVLLNRPDEAQTSFQRSLDLWRTLREPAGEAMVLVQMGRASAAAGRASEAIAHYQGARAAARRAQLPDAIHQQFDATIAEQLGYAYHSMRDFTAAATSLEEALASGEAAGNGEPNLLLLNNLADTYLNLGGFKRAMALLERALEVARERGDRGMEHALLNNLGSAHQGLGQYAEAKQLFQDALTRARRSADADAQAITLNNLGDVSREEGRYDDALEFFERALPIMRKIGDRQHEATVLNNIGEVRRAQARYFDALKAYQASLDIEQTLPLEAQDATVHSNLAQLYASVAQYARAAEEAKAAVAVYQRQGDRSAEATAWNDMGEILVAQHDLSGALPLFDRALAIAREIGEPATVAVSLGNKGSSYLAMGRPKDALAEFEEAYAIQRKAGLLAAALVTLNNIGSAHVLLKNYDVALTSLEQARQLARQIGRASDEAQVVASMGAVYESRGSVERALSLYEEALGGLEKVREGLKVEELKTTWTAQLHVLYERAVRLYAATGNTARAFDLAERARARTFLDQIGNLRPRVTGAADAGLVQQEQFLRAEIAHLQKARSDAVQSVDAMGEARDALAARLIERQRQYEDLLLKLKVASPQYASLISVSPLGLSEVQALLTDQQTLLAYFVMADKSLAFVISKGGVNRVDLAVGEQQLSAAIQEFRSFPNVSEAAADTAQLYHWLIAPLTSYLKTPLVTIVPHASLHYLPFAALADGSTSFGEQHAISYLPSASALKFVSSGPISRGSVLALSMARGEGLPILRFADDEARTVAALYGVHPLVGEEATETALMTHAADASILHIAAHAELNATAPLFSRILLKGDERSDGSLELREIYDLTLHKTALVVLSACATQVGPGSAGDDLVTLNRAFLYAGASAVVASLWKVDDPATALFMKSFHTYVSNGRGKAAALSAAQADVRAKYPHPYYWSAFVLTGDPN